MGESVDTSLDYKDFSSEETCAEECCSHEECQSAIYYPEYNECYLYKNRHCDVPSNFVDRAFSHYKVVYLGKNRCK